MPRNDHAANADPATSRITHDECSESESEQSERSVTATEPTFDDLDCLGELMMELHEAGRINEAHSLARIYSAVQGVVAEAEGLDTGTGEDDPEFVAAMEEAEADIAAGRLIPHEEVERRWRARAGG